MKKFVALALALVLVFSMGVPSFGATSVTVDESGVFAPDNSNTNYATSTVFTGLNILEAIRILVDSSAYDVHQMKTLFSSGVYRTVANTLNLYFNGSASDISSYGNENLYLMQSAFYYLGRTLQSMNYYTPYTDSLVSFDDALNYNLLYITNQLKVIANNLSGSSTVISGLMSGWSMSGVPSPEGYDTSWYYRVLQNVGSLATYFRRLYNGTWADSTNYADSFFYKTYLQNLTMEENSELFEAKYLEDTFISRKHMNTAVGNVNADFATAVNNSLFTTAMVLSFPFSNSYFDYLDNSKVSVTGGPGGPLVAIANAEVSSLSFLSRLAYVLADDEEIRLNETLQDSKTEVVDFVGNGVTSSGGSSLSLMSGITDSISFATDFNEYFSMPDVGIGDIFGVFADTSESLSWFTEETASNIDTVPVTYSRTPNPQTEVVTSYYEDRKSEFNEIWGDIVD